MAIVAPRKGKYRRKLYTRCGKTCFLGENESFPVYPSLRMILRDSKGRFARNPCLPECRGVASAKVRARQWKHKKVATRAIHLEEEVEMLDLI